MTNKYVGHNKSLELKNLKYIIPILLFVSCSTSNTDYEQDEKILEVKPSENVAKVNDYFVPLKKTAPIKLIVPGEHLGWKMETFDEYNQAISINIEQNEKWIAVYVDSSSFFAKIENLTWDTTENFTIQSDTVNQPMFYIQGIDNILQNGSGTSFSWQDFNSRNPLKWNFLETTFTILNSIDSNCNKIANHKYGTINSDVELTIFKILDEQLLDSMQISEENTVRLFWTGDLNGDNEPDFFIGLNTHHEVGKMEVILSNKTDGKTEWKRLARFNLWV